MNLWYNIGNYKLTPRRREPSEVVRHSEVITMSAPDPTTDSNLGLNSRYLMGAIMRKQTAASHCARFAPMFSGYSGIVESGFYHDSDR